MLEAVGNTWLDIKKVFQDEFGNEVYNSWLSKLNFVSYDLYELVMSVETNFIKEWISKEFLNGEKRKINGKFVWYKKGIKQILLEKFNIKYEKLQKYLGNCKNQCIIILSVYYIL